MKLELEQMIVALEGAGLNHWGVVGGRRYDEISAPTLKRHVLQPGAKSIIVFASGGTRLWDNFVSAIQHDPSRLQEEQHPLDAYVRHQVELASEHLGGVPHRWFFAAADAEIHLDFRTLAVAAGIGSPSKLGLVIDRRFGPWMGMRAACMLPWTLPESAVADDLCEPCTAPCVSACPGDAFPGQTWDVGRCATFHQVSDRCAMSCDSRRACPVGQEQQYSELQMRYHYNRRIGRLSLAQSIGIEDNNYLGLGPDWSGWAG